MIIEVESLRLEYEGSGRYRRLKGKGRGERTTVIEELSFGVAPEESLAIIGPSGCGKTSLLFVLCGLIRPTSGRVRVQGEEVRGPRRDVALILQDIGLLPWKTVWKNVTLGLHVDGRGDRERIRRLLAELGLEGLEDRYPSQLSGGQLRRVGLARALAREPAILLMDEPLASLDALTKERLQEQVLQLWRERELAMVLVTHDIEEAVFLGERILVLTDRPATLKAEIANPGMGEVEYRRSELFYKKVQELRDLL